MDKKFFEEVDALSGLIMDVIDNYRLLKSKTRNTSYQITNAIALNATLMALSSVIFNLVVSYRQTSLPPEKMQEMIDDVQKSLANTTSGLYSKYMDSGGILMQEIDLFPNENQNQG